MAETYGDSAEAAGLLALFLLNEARRQARLAPDGNAVPLSEQDRTRWDRDAIQSASTLLERALARGHPGPFQIEAAITATHCRAQTAGEAAWDEIAALYAMLEGFRPIPAVRVNRAFAVSKVEGPAQALALLAQTDIEADAYPYAHLVRATLLGDLGQVDAASACLKQALTSARNEQERRQIRERIEQLQSRQNR